MKIKAIDSEIIVSELYCGIGIETSQGEFGICQRDGGIDVMLDGKLVWSSTHHPQLEQLAALEHEQWAHWTRYMLKEIFNYLHDEDESVAVEILQMNQNVRRWFKQIETVYEDLTEKEKESDREWALKVLRVLGGVET
jgi:hypothetical protein